MRELVRIMSLRFRLSVLQLRWKAFFIGDLDVFSKIWKAKNDMNIFRWHYCNLVSSQIAFLFWKKGQKMRAVETIGVKTKTSFEFENQLFHVWSIFFGWLTWKYYLCTQKKFWSYLVGRSIVLNLKIALKLSFQLYWNLLT